MLQIPESIRKQISNPHPDIKQFEAVLKGAKPDRVHLAELFADAEVMEWITTDIFGKQWVPAPTDEKNITQMKQHLLCAIEYWYRMGYDYIRVIGGIKFSSKRLFSNGKSGDVSVEHRSWSDAQHGPIQNWDDFESYPWPIVKDENLWHYEFVAEHLPDGMGMMVCPESGFREIAMDTLVGYESFAMMMYDQPELVTAIFEKSGQAILDVYSRVVKLPKVAGFFQGDDMGFKTSTLVSPNFLRSHVLPYHRAAAQIAHAHSKVYLLHSCGNVSDIMDDLINDVKIDAKHSFEDGILPVEEFYNVYNAHIAAIGGLDVNLLAGADESAVRKRCKQILASCWRCGRYAFGSGNTITNYCKKENVLAMFDEAYSWA